MASLVFFGNDQIEQDDLTQSPWNPQGAVTVSARGDGTGPYGIGNSYLVNKPTTSGVGLLAQSISNEDGQQRAFVWVKGTSDTSSVTIGTHRTAVGFIGAETGRIRVGPGSLSYNSNYARINGLQEDEWSLVEIESDSISAGVNTFNLYIYPGSTTTEGSVVVGPCRVASLQEVTPYWQLPTDSVNDSDIAMTTAVGWNIVPFNDAYTLNFTYPSDTSSETFALGGIPIFLTADNLGYATIGCDLIDTAEEIDYAMVGGIPLTVFRFGEAYKIALIGLDDTYDESVDFVIKGYPAVARRKGNRWYLLVNEVPQIRDEDLTPVPTTPAPTTLGPTTPATTATDPPTTPPATTLFIP